jgi:hypothetical protein
MVSTPLIHAATATGTDSMAEKSKIASCAVSDAPGRRVAPPTENATGQRKSVFRLRDVFVKVVTGHTTVENAFVLWVHGDRIAGTDIGTVARVDRKTPVRNGQSIRHGDNPGGPIDQSHSHGGTPFVSEIDWLDSDLGQL